MSTDWNTSPKIRQAEDNYLRMLKDVLLQAPCIVITHEGPDCPPAAGNPALREGYEAWAKTCAETGIAAPLLVCGHRRLPAPLAESSHGM